MSVDWEIVTEMCLGRVHLIEIGHTFPMTYHVNVYISGKPVLSAVFWYARPWNSMSRSNAMRV